MPNLEPVDLVLTDPPYGINHKSSMTGHNGGTALPGILGDTDTILRDCAIALMEPLPQIVFGSWKVQKPKGCKALLIWEKGDHVGMGDLSMPWKPNTEEIYIIGSGFNGHRGSSVLRFNAPVSWNSVLFGRCHPNQKPIGLIVELLTKAPQGKVLDPFIGSGTTAVACERLNRRWIGIEIEEKYCEIAAKRIEKERSQLKLW